MTRNISLRFTACIALSLLCTFVSPTPVEKAAAAQISEAPQIAQRDVVTVTKDAGLQAASQINAPYYDPSCQVGGCTFDYEASGIHAIIYEARKQHS